jgi:peptide/nickel transport system permease protein
MGGTLYIAFIYSLANLIVDILYALLDPRMRM